MLVTRGSVWNLAESSNTSKPTLKRVNRNKASFSPRLLYLKSPEFCKNEIQKWGHLAPKNVKSKSPDFCIFFFKSWGSPHFCKNILQNSGQINMHNLIEII